MEVAYTLAYRPHHHQVNNNCSSTEQLVSDSSTCSVEQHVNVVSQSETSPSSNHQGRSSPTLPKPFPPTQLNNISNSLATTWINVAFTTDDDETVVSTAPTTNNNTIDEVVATVAPTVATISPLPSYDAIVSLTDLPETVGNDVIRRRSEFRHHRRRADEPANVIESSAFRVSTSSTLSSADNDDHREQRHYNCCDGQFGGYKRCPVCCVRSLLVITSLRFLLISTALIGAAGVIVGITLGALNMVVGNDFLTLSLIFIGESVSRLFVEMCVERIKRISR